MPRKAVSTGLPPPQQSCKGPSSCVRLWSLPTASGWCEWGTGKNIRPATVRYLATGPTVVSESCAISLFNPLSYLALSTYLFGAAFVVAKGAEDSVFKELEEVLAVFSLLFGSFERLVSDVEAVCFLHFPTTVASRLGVA